MHIVKVNCESVRCSAVSDSFQPHGLSHTRLLCPWDSPDRNTGVGCLFLLQGIVPVQGSEPGSLHCRQIVYHLSHQGNGYANKSNTVHRQIFFSANTFC